MADKKSFLLRLNPEVWKEIERWAAEEFRSVNGQIEFILHEAVRQRRKKSQPAAGPAAGLDPGKEKQ
jgi:hypothetical protein